MPFSIVQESGVGSVTAQVNNNSTLLTLQCSGFQSSGLLVIKINVDDFDTWANGVCDPVVDGDEFAGSHFTAVFTAPHYEPLTVSGTYVSPYGNLSTEYGLDLPPDDYMPPSTIPEPVYTAGLGTSMEQTPLPITLSGTVFDDLNADNKQETGDLGIAGVQLTLYELEQRQLCRHRQDDHHGRQRKLRVHRTSARHVPSRRDAAERLSERRRHARHRQRPNPRRGDHA